MGSVLQKIDTFGWVIEHGPRRKLSVEVLIVKSACYTDTDVDTKSYNTVFWTIILFPHMKAVL